MKYYPSFWRLVKIQYNGDTIYKLLGTWIDDTWRLNSGITKVEYDENKDLYLVYGTSGSIYVCNPFAEVTTGLMCSVLDGLRYRIYSDGKDATIDLIYLSDFLKE